jgi:ArsR family transcriptional regulator
VPRAVCSPDEHPPRRTGATAEAADLERAARLFQALGDAPRLRLLELLRGGERCVSELVEAGGEKFSTVSQRLRLLRGEGLIARRRQGKHVFYSLSDQHVAELLETALAHARELAAGPRPVSAKNPNPKKGT